MTTQETVSSDERRAWLAQRFDVVAARLYPHLSIRLTLAGLIAGGAVFARYVLQVENLPLTALLSLAACIAGYNLAAALLTRPCRLHPSARQFERLTGFTYVVVALDYLALTIAIWLVGGSRSPFMVFFVLHLAVNCLLMPRRAAIAFSVLAFGLLAGLVLGEWLGIVPPRQPIGVIGGYGPIDGRYALTLIVVNGLLFSLITFMLVTLAGWLHVEERRANLAGAELAHLSNLRRDFLGVTLHNLQSPLGAVTMLLENLRAEQGDPSSEKLDKSLDRCLHRLHEMTSFLRDLQTLALLEGGEVSRPNKPVDIHAVLRQVVEQHRERARDRGQVLELVTEDPLPPVLGVEPLLREAVANYVTNAIKYTPEGGRITVRARHEAPRVRIEVQDNGIGIAPEDQGHVFEDFVRLKHADEQERGSGLGLGIVHRIVQCHGGTVGLESEPGRGSTFSMDLLCDGSTA